MSVKPESFAAVDREYQESNAEMERLNQSLETLGKERRRVEGELSDQQELLKKYQGQLMQVKNQQQYAAAWKEIDAARKHVKELEESALKTMTEIDGIQAQLDARKSQFDDLKSRHDQAHAEWQSSLGDLRSEAGALRKKSDQLEAALPEQARREFQRTFRQRGGIAVAKVVNDSCTSCRTRIRPALAQRLRRGELVICEGCHRILYLEKPVS
jgi:predicted  nucleic acid-binding Zn-ribbon protein